MRDKFIYEKTMFLFFSMVAITAFIVHACKGEDESTDCYNQRVEVSSRVDTVYIGCPAVLITPTDTLYVNPSKTLHGHGE